MQQIIPIDRSLIIACDVPLRKLPRIIRATTDNKKVGGYKIPFISGLEGWGKWCDTARKYTNKPLILDSQKQVPDPLKEVNKRNLKAIKFGGLDVVIVFPLTGPKTQREFVEAALEQDLGVIVGGMMTHPKYKLTDGGYISDGKIDDIYKNASLQGINNFLVPGNNPKYIKWIKSWIEAQGVNPIFYSPGLITQGGEISEAAKVSGERFHAIVGRGIYWNSNQERFNSEEEIRQAAINLTSKL